MSKPVQGFLTTVPYLFTLPHEVTESGLQAIMKLWKPGTLFCGLGVKSIGRYMICSNICDLIKTRCRISCSPLLLILGRNQKFLPKEIKQGRKGGKDKSRVFHFPQKILNYIRFQKLLIIQHSTSSHPSNLSGMKRIHRSSYDHSAIIIISSTSISRNRQGWPQAFAQAAMKGKVELLSSLLNMWPEMGIETKYARGQGSLKSEKKRTQSKTKTQTHSQFGSVVQCSWLICTCCPSYGEL